MLTRPALLLRIEEALFLVGAVLLYAHFHFSWLLFAILILAPDLFMLGYLLNPRAGAAIYNLAHTLAIPVILFATAYFKNSPRVAAIALIWTAHIAFDRLLGYGLKYPLKFNDTHLQHIP